MIEIFVYNSGLRENKDSLCSRRIAPRRQVYVVCASLTACGTTRQTQSSQAKSLHIESRFRSEYLFGRMILSERSAAFRNYTLAGNGFEPVEPRRVVNQDLLADRSVRHPLRQLVEEEAVVDPERRGNLGQRLAAAVIRIRMRPVGAPHDP